MLWDIFQQAQIERNRRDTEEASELARESSDNSRLVEDRIEKLSLITKAVWSFLKEKERLDDIDLINRIEEIDMQDGVKDGKATDVAKTCLGCGRKISTRFKTCMFCDAPNPNYSPFSET